MGCTVLMLADIFDSAEIVRVIDFLLDDPEGEYSKTDIARGATISRPTLYRRWSKIRKLGLLSPARRFGATQLYRLNTDSQLVKSLLKFDNELAKAVFHAGTAATVGTHTVEAGEAVEPAPKLVETESAISVKPSQ